MNSPKKEYIISAFLIASILIVSACAAPTPMPMAIPTEIPQPAAIPTEACKPQTVNVFAAASLTEAFKEMAPLFQTAEPCAALTFNFGGSQKLSQQLQDGAPADVFASASGKNMDEVKTAGLVAEDGSQIFARNGLAVVVCPKTTFKIEEVKDLAQPGLKLLIAAKEVPVGGYTDQFLEKAAADAALGQSFMDAVKANEVSFEADVKSVLAKVDVCEADAGIVYKSDGFTDKTEGIRYFLIPEALNILAKYPIAVVKTSANPELAQKFVDFVLSARGQQVLEKNGFLKAR
jgi:molybdate transport system substrate-binding protein